MNNKNYSGDRHRRDKGYRNNSSNQYRNYQPSARNNTPCKFKLKDTVIINVHAPGSLKKIFLCEAVVVRLPKYYNGPYKLLITSVRLNSSDYQELFLAQKLLKLKLLRKQENTNPNETSHWTRQGQENWVRLDKAKVELEVQRTITNINKNKKINHR